MSVVLDALVLFGGIALGRWVARSIRGKRPREDRPLAAGPGDAGSPPANPFASFPCKLGDVVVRALERDEAWLAGALVFEEERPVAALFVAPEAGGDRAVFVRVASGAALLWLSPLAGRELPLTSDPPFTVERKGARFERARRLPVRVTCAGAGAPNVGDRAVVAEYEGPGSQRIVVVAGVEQTLAWEGVALAPAEYDVWPGDAAPPGL